jgi:type IV pilus assembly protein PilB
MANMLGELLKDRKLVDEAALQQALRVAKQTGKKLGEVLVESGVVSAQDVMETLREGQLELEPIKLGQYPLNPEVSMLVPRQTCEKFVCVPLAFGPNNSLHVAVSDSLDLEVVQYLKFITGKNILTSLASETEIWDAIGRLYDFGKSLEEIMANVAVSGGVELISPGLDERVTDSNSDTVRQIVKTVLGDAVAKGASDIHMEPHPNFLRIRIRVDGELRNLINVPKWLQPQITACTKVQANMDIAVKRVPQDGKLSATIAGRQVDFRVSTLPTPHGEKVVIRVMDKAQKRNSLDGLDLPAPLLNHVKTLLQHNKGMILVTGPTGSGKTSLLYAMLGELQATGTNIVTVEDPIEYEFVGITQTQINEKAGLTFPSILRSILRQDPNVVMVGEIRDQQTAEIAFRAAQTGHLVLSSLHTNGAAAAVRRLVDLGIEPYMISSTVLGIFAQRLVRRNCPECVAEDKTSDAQHLQYFRRRASGSGTFLRGRGCNACTNTGYRGRIGVYELLRFTPPIVDAVNAGLPEDQIAKAAVADGMTTLADECVRLVAEGVTSVSESSAIVGALESSDVVKACACPACGRDISPDFLACPYCLHALRRSCPKCGSPIEQGWRACPHCMTVLDLNVLPAASHLGAPAKPADKPRVLIVDDYAPLRKLVSITLTQIGCEVLEATDGGDALDKVESYRPDLIISDITMPVMDGYQFCKQVRKSMGTAFIPFIMLTSRDHAEDKLKGFIHGTDDYLTKPFDYRELQARVKRLLARTAMAPVPHAPAPATYDV